MCKSHRFCCYYGSVRKSVEAIAHQSVADQNFLNFIQFLGKYVGPFPWRIGAPSYGESWILEPGVWSDVFGVYRILCN